MPGEPAPKTTDWRVQAMARGLRAAEPSMSEERAAILAFAAFSGLEAEALRWNPSTHIYTAASAATKELKEAVGLTHMPGDELEIALEGPKGRRVVSFSRTYEAMARHLAMLAGAEDA